MALVTLDDFIDIYQKTAQRGVQFMLSKLNPNAISRTKSAFSDSAMSSANWWIIPAVKKRWNHKITGDEHIEYESYTLDKYFKDQKNLSMLSIGSGVCSHELKFATSDTFSKITCVDIADNMLRKAEQEARNKNLTNMEFLTVDIWKHKIDPASYDVVFFHSSLHHFDNIPSFISEKIKVWLKPGGKLIINEYVGPNRLQFPQIQKQYINKGLGLLTAKYKKRFKSNLSKNKFYGSGYLRMVIADPSECVASAAILPEIYKHFTVAEEKPYGGNLLMNILKDIAHNFVDETQETKVELKKIFDLEDAFLKSNPSDFIFGIYEKK
jgi:ubiquinone/menaquinone biosynthesis C-methylase UbiE